MALREPVEIPALDSLGWTHFINIGGAGMSGVASVLAQSGVPVTGSDPVDTASLRVLADQGIATYVGSDVGHLGDARTVVVSSATRADHVELVEARRRGLRILHRSTALAAVVATHRRRIAVGGTHGKTTTTAMTAQVLTGCGLDASFVIGGTFAATGSGARLGDGSIIVVEADESDQTFLQYPADIVVVTNVEADHLDNWGTPERYRAGFVRFVSADQVSCAVVDLDDAGVSDLIVAAPGGGPYTTYGEDAAATVRLAGICADSDTSTATVTAGSWTGRLSLQAAGRHNLHNAAAVVTVARQLGLDLDRALAALAEFTGTTRRFQLVGEVAGVRIIDDYAHHPTELRLNIQAARTVVTERTGRLVVCFQPHLFSRTRDFAAAFGQALAGADIAVVLGIYPSREDPLPGVTGRLVADAIPAGAAEVHYVESVSDAAAALADLVGAGDLVLTAGAGDVTTVGPQLARLLAGREEGDP